MRLPADYDPGPIADARLEAAPPAGRVLCFAPHPDDEVIGPGGVLALHRRQADPVHVALATDGVAGDPDGHFPAAGYAERRRAESRRGLGELGVEQVGFWGYPDAAVITAADLEGVTRRAAEALDQVRPDVVYLPWPGERNADHRALCLAVVRALTRTGFRGTARGYEVWTPCEPDLVIDVTPVIEAKRRALACYTTQLRYVDYRHVILGLNAYRSLLHGRGSGYFEAFVTIDVGG